MISSKQFIKSMQSKELHRKVHGGGRGVLGPRIKFLSRGPPDWTEGARKPLRTLSKTRESWGIMAISRLPSPRKPRSLKGSRTEIE